MKNERIYLEQIIDCIDKVRDFTKGMNYEQFSDDQKTQSAVIMQLTLMGELAKKISSDTRSQITIPWKEISGFRDRAVHDCYEIDLSIVWQTILDDLSVLRKEVKIYLSS